MKIRLTRGGIPTNAQTAEAWREWAKNPRATVRCSPAAWKELKAAIGGGHEPPKSETPLALAFVGIPIFVDESVPWIDADLPDSHRFGPIVAAFEGRFEGGLVRLEPRPVLPPLDYSFNWSLYGPADEEP